MVTSARPGLIRRGWASWPQLKGKCIICPTGQLEVTGNVTEQKANKEGSGAGSLKSVFKPRQELIVGLLHHSTSSYH